MQVFCFFTFHDSDELKTSEEDFETLLKEGELFLPLIDKHKRRKLKKENDKEEKEEEEE